MSLVDSFQLAALIREQGPSVTGWLFLIALIGIVVAFMLGNVLSKAFNYKEHATRISVVLTTIMIALMPFVAQMMLGSSEQSNYEQSVARWEEYQGREGLSQEAIDELKEAKPDLEIRQ